MNPGLLATIGILLMTSLAFAQNPVRVACVGDSITYGDKLSDRATQSYPAVLERLAQGRFAVGNFGTNATTALKNTGRAWTDTPDCRNALAFNPGLVVILLGINDLNYPGQCARYPADLREIVTRFQSLSSAPRIFLCTLTPLGPEEFLTTGNALIRDTMNPAIRAVAAETGAQVIDLHAVFPNRLDFLPDGLHPSPAGAELIAHTVFEAIDAAAAPPPRIRPAPASGPVDISIRNEALAAQTRAEQWMKTQPPPADLQDPRAAWKDRELRAPEDVSPWLVLLDPDAKRLSPNPYFEYAALADALVRIGHETVFLADGRPVAWREALLHQLVQRQQIDARGDGFWRDTVAEDPAADSLRSTAYALQAIATTLGK